MGLLESLDVYPKKARVSGSKRRVQHKNDCWKTKNSVVEYQKLLEIENEIVREMVWGDKPYRRKSADRKAQISPLSWTNAFLICALRSAVFLR